MIQSILGESAPFDASRRQALVLGALAAPLLIVGFAMAPPSGSDHVAGFVGGTAALVGGAVRQTRADVARGVPGAVPRGIARFALWMAVCWAGVLLALYLNPILAADTFEPAAVLLTLGMGLGIVATGLWGHITHEQGVVWAAWGGIGLIGLGLVAAVLGAGLLALLWIVPGVALVTWQLLQQRRAA